MRSAQSAQRPRDRLAWPGGARKDVSAAEPLAPWLFAGGNTWKQVWALVVDTSEVYMKFSVGTILEEYSLMQPRMSHAQIFKPVERRGR